MESNVELSCKLYYDPLIGSFSAAYSYSDTYLNIHLEIWTNLTKKSSKLRTAQAQSPRCQFHLESRRNLYDFLPSNEQQSKSMRIALLLLLSKISPFLIMLLLKEEE